MKKKTPPEMFFAAVAAFGFSAYVMRCAQNWITVSGEVASGQLDAAMASGRLYVDGINLIFLILPMPLGYLLAAVAIDRWFQPVSGWRRCGLAMVAGVVAAALVPVFQLTASIWFGRHGSFMGYLSVSAAAAAIAGAIVYFVAVPRARAIDDS